MFFFGWWFEDLGELLVEILGTVGVFKHMFQSCLDFRLGQETATTRADWH